MAYNFVVLTPFDGSISEFYRAVLFRNAVRVSITYATKCLCAKLSPFSEQAHPLIYFIFGSNQRERLNRTRYAKIRHHYCVNDVICAGILSFGFRR